MAQAEGAPRGGPRPTFKELLAQGEPILLPAAHDALTARLIARAGFKAYQIGGFAVAGARFGLPDIDLNHFWEQAEAVREIVSVCPLPVLVDCDDGYGDVKNVTRTVGGYEAMGVTGLFIEDQRAPKSCGQMGKKEVIPPEEMANKVRAAVAARRNPDTFLMARTDGRSAKGVDEAIRRAGVYLEAGADGIYVEGLRSARELKRVGKALPGVPLATTLMEGGGQLDWLTPEEIYGYGFALIFYPTTVLFRATKAIQRALADLNAGKPMRESDAVDLDEFEEIVGLPAWQQIENTFQKG